MQLQDVASYPLTHSITLPSCNKAVSVRKVSLQFTRWSGEAEWKDSWNKTVVDIGGQPQLAELAILEILRSDGWQGVWVSRRNNFRTIWWPKEQRSQKASIPSERLEQLDQVYERAKLEERGCWDLYCWKDHRVLFVESKHKGRDGLTQEQKQWLDAALDIGIPLDSFLLVEWTLAP